MSRHRMSSDVSTSSDEAFLEELAKGTLRNMRVLWCELPEVCRQHFAMLTFVKVLGFFRQCHENSFYLLLKV